MNIFWHINREIEKFCEDRKLAINPITQDGNIYSQLMFSPFTKKELAAQETVEQVKQLYIQRLENLIITIKNDLEQPDADAP